MTVVDDAHPARPAPQQDGEVDNVGVVGRVGIDDPLQEAHAPSLGIAAPVVDALLERLAEEVGYEQRRRAWAAVLVGRPHHGL